MNKSNSDPRLICLSR